MAAVIDIEKCTGCALCVDACPVESIKIDNDLAQVDADTCTECGACQDECPNGAISVP